MKVFVDSENRIKDVHSTSDPTLKELDINDKNNPFSGWSIAKICCYKVTVLDGEVTGYTPYVSSSLLDVVDMLGHDIDAVTPYTATKTAYYNEKEKTFYKVPKGNVTVLFDNYNGEYTVTRVVDRVTVSFERLTEKTNITISVK